MSETIGVLVMAYGTPAKVEDILPYYTDIRRGHAPTPEQLHELTERYMAIGFPTKLTTITFAQAASIEQALNADGSTRYKAYVGMRHWEPWIKDAVQQMYADGIRKAVAVVMAPQGSKMSSQAYMAKVQEAVAALPEPIEVQQVLSWHLEPDFLTAVQEKLEAALAKFPEASRATLPVVFTCHSLPERILQWGDPYPEHLKEIGQAMAERCGLGNIHFAFQSAGRTPEPWLGPDIQEFVRAQAAAGEKSLLICCVGFVLDHLEVKYDLDIEALPLARELGLHAERTESLNDNPLLASALATVVRREVTKAGWVK